MDMDDRTVKERVSDYSENPYLKIVARVAMVFVTFIAAPVIYWVITTMLSVNTTLSTILIIQKTQQEQVQVLTNTQGAIIGTQAQEAQTRAVTDAQLEQQVKGVKESLQRTDAQLEKQKDSLDSLRETIYNERNRNTP